MEDDNGLSLSKGKHNRANEYLSLLFSNAFNLLVKVYGFKYKIGFFKKILASNLKEEIANFLILANVVLFQFQTKAI